MVKTIKCKYCGHKVPEDALSCPYCGASLTGEEEDHYCEICGRPVPAAEKPVGKCVVCGKDIYLCYKHRMKYKDEEIYCKEHQQECFIATAVFGTPIAPEIDILREFRNKFMSRTTVGKKIVRTYYRISPPIADTIRYNEFLKALFRIFIVRPWIFISEKILKH